MIGLIKVKRICKNCYYATKPYSSVSSKVHVYCTLTSLLMQYQTVCNRFKEKSSQKYCITCGKPCSNKQCIDCFKSHTVNYQGVSKLRQSRRKYI
jgi:NMD protein affecting ribosome stability and mRNA decay